MSKILSTDEKEKSLMYLATLINDIVNEWKSKGCVSEPPHISIGRKLGIYVNKKPYQSNIGKQ